MTDLLALMFHAGANLTGIPFPDETAWAEAGQDFSCCLVC